LSRKTKAGFIKQAQKFLKDTENCQARMSAGEQMRMAIPKV